MRGAAQIGKHRSETDYQQQQRREMCRASLRASQVVSQERDWERATWQCITSHDVAWQKHGMNFAAKRAGAWLAGSAWGDIRWVVVTRRVALTK